jgi:hypothetical protein
MTTTRIKLKRISTTYLAFAWNKLSRVDLPRTEGQWEIINPLRRLIMTEINKRGTPMFWSNGLIRSVVDAYGRSF